MIVFRFTNLGVPTGVSKFSSSLLPPGNPFVVARDANRFGAFIPPVLMPMLSPSSLVSISSSSLALEYAEDNSSESDSFVDFSSSESSVPVLLFSRLRRRRPFLFLWCWVVSTFFFSSRPPRWSSSCFAVQYLSTAVRESKLIATSATAARIARLVVVRGSITSLCRSYSLSLSLSLSRARALFQCALESNLSKRNVFSDARAEEERERERKKKGKRKKKASDPLSKGRLRCDASKVSLLFLALYCRAAV